MTESDQQIDATIKIITPENIAFRYRIAGPYRRLPAFFIDFLIRIGVWTGFMVLAGILSQGIFFDQFFGMALSLILLFIMEWLYGGLFETFWNGQTIGKRVMGIRVLSIDGQPINGLQAMMRNILRFADMMPMVPYAMVFDEPSPIPIPTFVLGLVTTLLTRRFQRLGDIVCGTMVVIDEKSWLFEPAKLEDPRVAQLAAEIPPSFNISRTMGQALATYVDRRQLFSPPRRREIARHIAEPLLPKFGLAADTSYDLLLCALYHRTFLSEEDAEVAMPNAYAEMQRQLAESNRAMLPPGVVPPQPQAVPSQAVSSVAAQPQVAQLPAAPGITPKTDLGRYFKSSGTTTSTRSSDTSAPPENGGSQQ